MSDINKQINICFPKSFSIDITNRFLRSLNYTKDSYSFQQIRYYFLHIFIHFPSRRIVRKPRLISIDVPKFPQNILFLSKLSNASSNTQILRTSRISSEGSHFYPYQYLVAIILEQLHQTEILSLASNVNRETGDSRTLPRTRCTVFRLFTNSNGPLDSTFIFDQDETACSYRALYRTRQRYIRIYRLGDRNRVKRNDASRMEFVFFSSERRRRDEKTGEKRDRRLGGGCALLRS